MLLASLPFYPLVSFLLLIIFSKRLSWQVASFISVGAMAIAALVSALLVLELSASQSQFISVNLWHWCNRRSCVDFAYFNRTGCGAGGKFGATYHE